MYPFSLKADDEFVNIGFDPSMRKNEIKKLAGQRKASITCELICVAILALICIGDIIVKAPMSKYYLFVFIIVLLQLIILYNIDTKIKFLKLIDRLYKD